jgi:large subunit ribosomal protein L15
MSNNTGTVNSSTPGATSALGQLKVPRGAHKKPKRVGRGTSSGHGKTSGRGQKGQRARSGHGIRLGFEGGQMPLSRRIPKHGFTSKFKREFQIVNLESLNILQENAIVSPNELKDFGLIKKLNRPVKILGEGNLSKPLTIKAHSFSKSAVEKIKKAGGEAIIEVTRSEGRCLEH